MKVGEFKKLISGIDSCHDGKEIVIPTRLNNRYGQSSYSDVKDILYGFDWDTGLIFIWPAEMLKKEAE